MEPIKKMIMTLFARTFLYLKKENYKEALLNYKKSLTDLKDEKKIDATLNIGLLFLEREVNYDSAIAYYQKALKISTMILGS